MEDDAHSCEHSSSEASSLVAEKLPTRNNIIRGQKHSYSVGRKIAQGRFGAVYEVLRRGDGKHFAAKLEVCDSHFHGLNMDYNVLKNANRASLKHFCQLIDRGKIEGHFKFMVMELLHENIDKYRQEFQGNRFSAPTCIRLGLEMLNSLEELHSLGFIHRDVKPSNFVVYEDKAETHIYIVDFGLCKQYRNSSGEMRTARERAQFRGTVRYASLAAHKETEQSPKDDLESWLYVLVELFTGELPWTHYRKSEKHMVTQLKEQARTPEGAQELLKYCPRMEFRRIMKYLDGLGYHSQIDYTYIRQLINLAMKNYDIKGDQPYDWQLDESGFDPNNESSTPRAHSSNSSSDGHPGTSPNHKPTVSEKLDKFVKQVNGKLKIEETNGRMQNGH